MNEVQAKKKGKKRSTKFFGRVCKKPDLEAMTQKCIRYTLPYMNGF